MYKSTHSNHDYLKRVASHSTKGSRRGYAEVLPPEAVAREDEYVSLSGQLDNMIEEHMRLQRRLEEIGTLKGYNMPRDEYRALEAERRALGEKINRSGERLSEFKRNVVRIGHESFSEVLVRCLKVVTPRDTFLAAVADAEALLQRKAAEYSSKNPEERTERAKEGLRDKNHRREKRRKGERLNLFLQRQAAREKPQNQDARFAMRQIVKPSSGTRDQ